ncbi:cyclin-A2 isoform X1 [Falco biarmicus]|uniref:cyclin-A2 isoform X1 n=1 Tax=Falco cherrug TaxID=345164 RepID=UPI002479A2AC|nr:cyclin-A2 isoform X1 [Falco cherrug]XP_055650081.1 cyclin-A2 isoform X1 [Falco peregrinus]XP_056214353.1 cyclin-A2 isoform X1 [Falco biarmicus]
MLAGQENQENVLPGGKAPPPAGPRVVLGLLRGAQQRSGQPPQVRRAGRAGAAVSGRAGPVEALTGRSPPQAARSGDEGPCAGRPSGGQQQQAFTIHVDEPDGERPRRRGGPTAQSEEAALGLRAAICTVGLRRPLAPLDNAMDISFDSPSKLDISISSEPEEKKPNVNNVPDYIGDIHMYLREMEVKCKPKMGYMKKQPDITNNMRAILVDWLVEVGEEYKLQNETLHLAVNYIDRFLSSMSVLRGKLQLVGTAAMLLASKFEEIYPPEVAEFVYITDDTYTKKQVLRMEHLILKVLSFDLAAPTINQFLTQYFLHKQTNGKVESLSMYLGELSLIDADPYLKYLPSVIAAAAFHLAGYTITGQTWPESLCEVTGYTLEDIKPCLMDLHQTYLKAAQHMQQSIREKYKSAKYYGVSLIDPPETLDLL